MVFRANPDHPLGSMNIKGNDLVNKAIKKEIELQYKIPESYISLAFIKRKIREKALIKWDNIWSNSKSKDKYYK